MSGFELEIGRTDNGWVTLYNELFQNMRGKETIANIAHAFHLIDLFVKHFHVINKLTSTLQLTNFRVKR